MTGIERIFCVSATIGGLAQSKIARGSKTRNDMLGRDKLVKHWGFSAALIRPLDTIRTYQLRRFGVE
jgi:hypothetical protein